MSQPSKDWKSSPAPSRPALSGRGPQHRARKYAWLLVPALFVGCDFAESDPAEATRPAKWAQRVEVAGVPNLYRVSPTLYRSAQPRGNSLRDLSALGINTVVSLRVFRWAARSARDEGLTYVHIPMTAWNPEYADVVRFLKVVSDVRHAPVLVHCRRGADRTGFMVAIYRIVVQGWSKADAVEEMTAGGFEFNDAWTGLIEFIRELDVEALRAEAGISG